MMSWLSKVFKSKSMGRLLYWAAVAVSIVTLIITFAQLGWVQTFGWIYSISFAVSAVPEAMACIKKGKTDVADGTIFCWISGEITGLVYGFGIAELPLIFNCGVNAIFVGIIVWFRLFPRNPR